MARTVETMTAREFERMRALTALETYPDGSEIYYCSRCSFQHAPLTAGANRCPDCHSGESLCYVKNDAEFRRIHATGRLFSPHDVWRLNLARAHP